MTQTENKEEVITGLLQRLAMLRGWSPRTTESYRSDLLHAEVFFHRSGSSLMQADSAIILKYLGALSREGMKESTIQRRRSALSTWYNYLQDQEFAKIILPGICPACVKAAHYRN